MAEPRAFDAGSVRAIVFDLDGTLVDSYAPIAASLNQAREKFGLPALAPEIVRAGVGRGLESLIAEFVGADRVSAGVRLLARNRSTTARLSCPASRSITGGRRSPS